MAKVELKREQNGSGSAMPAVQAMDCLNIPTSVRNTTVATKDVKVAHGNLTKFEEPAKVW